MHDSPEKIFLQNFRISKAKFLRLQNIVKINNEKIKATAKTSFILATQYLVLFWQTIILIEIFIFFKIFLRYFIMNKLRNFLRNCFFKFLGRKYHFCSKVSQKLMIEIFWSNLRCFDLISKCSKFYFEQIIDILIWFLSNFIRLKKVRLVLGTVPGVQSKPSQES